MFENSHNDGHTSKNGQSIFTKILFYTSGFFVKKIFLSIKKGLTFIKFQEGSPQNCSHF